MATYQGILLSKSPFYVVEAINSGATSVMEIRIWNGDFNTEPVDATYSLSKQAISPSTTNVSFEIARIINDSLEHNSTIYTDSSSGKTEALWVNVKTFNGDSNRDDTWLVLDAYSDFINGLNSTISDVVLISERILYHYPNIPLRFPVYCDGTSNANYVTFRNGTTEIFTESLISYINSDNSYDKIQYINYLNTGQTVNNVVIKNNVGTIIDTIVIIPMECSMYDESVIGFVNRFGVNQEFVFNMKFKSRLNIDKKTYNRQTLIYVNGVPSYNTTKHVYNDFNTNLRESFTLNTNYIDESLNDTIGQLISSEYVWLRIGENSYPVNVKTSNLEYKKTINDNLIQYTINFEYAFDKRNNIY